MLARANSRRRWRSIVMLAVVVGVVGAVVLSAVAGARRSDSALERFNASSRSADVQILIGGLVPPTQSQLHAVARVRGVASFATLHVFGITFPRAPNLADTAAATDSKFGTAVDSARIVAGREAAPTAADEVTISESFASKLQLGVGDHLDGVSYSAAQVATAFNNNTNPPGTPTGPRFRLRIVGVVRRPLDLGDRAANGGVLVETPAFYRAYADKMGSYGTVFRIRTRHGASDINRVGTAVQRIFPQAVFSQVSPLAVENNGAQDAIDVLTAALWIFAGVAALAGAVAIAIILTREVSLASADQPTLYALGLTRRQRAAVNAYPALLAAATGAALAALGAVAASPLFPFGVARRADPDVGVHVDWLVVGLGVIAVTAIVVAIGVVAAVRSTRRSILEVEDATRRRPSSVVEFAAGVGLPPTATSGLRMAFEPGRGRTAVPIRSAYFGAVFGVAGLIAVLTFASSVQHLAATPRLFGWTADYAATDNDATTGTSCGRADYGLTRTRGIAAVAAVCSSAVQLDGHTFTGFNYIHLRGAIAPEVIEGHAPNGTHQVALGTVTLRTLDKQVGDSVRARGPHANHSYRIVGRVELPDLGSVQPLADGAIFTNAGLQQVVDPNTTSRYLVIRFAPGANRARIEHHIASDPDFASPTGVTVPPEVDRLRRINWFPITIAALLAALALIAVGHALVTGVRRRRRDLAVLKTLGFNRRQVRTTIAWQATALAGVGLAIGIPVGLAIGSFIWRLVANNTGVPTTAAVPIAVVLLTIPAVLLIVNIIGYLPARAAARTQPAIALRSE